jgi:hypothetical protein
VQPASMVADDKARRIAMYLPRRGMGDLQTNAEAYSGVYWSIID